MLAYLTRHQARITHAAGPCAHLLAEIRAGKHPSPPSDAPKARSNPLQRAVLAAWQAGAIPEPLAGALLGFADDTATPARRSEAAHRAGRSLIALEEEAHAGRLHRTQEKALTRDVDEARATWTAVETRIDGLLARIYRDPQAARQVLDKITLTFSGPGDLARALAARPEGLAELRGSALVFRASEERSRALALVPELVSAVEQSGRWEQTLHDRREARSDLAARPKRVPALTRSLAALTVLDAVQAAFPSPDPVTGHTLLQAAHELALTATRANLHDIPATYAARLADQLTRLDAVVALTRLREPATAVSRYIASRQVLADNLLAHRRLMDAGEIIGADQAAQWATVAQTERTAAARTLLTDYGANQAAAAAGLLPEVQAFDADHRAGQAGVIPQGIDSSQGYR